MNAGDELRLRFRRRRRRPTGWTRDFVLVGDGWEKDGDYNTSFSKTVLPLPSPRSSRLRGIARPARARRRSRLPAASRRTGRRIHTRFVTPRAFLDGLAVNARAATSGRCGWSRSARASGVVWAVVLVASLVARRRCSAISRSVRRRRRGGRRADALARYGFRARGSQRSGSASTSMHQAPTFDARLDHIMPQVASMGAAVAVADFDRDGWQDFYVTNSAEGSLNRLYRNQGDGTFKDVAPAMGVADVNRAGTGVSMGAVWGDYDNDGYEDLFLYKYGRPELFHNDAGPSVHARSRARRPAALGQRQQRRLARLRPRRPARSVPRRLLARGRRSLASEDDADHAGELRVREERRPQVPVPQPRRRHVRGRRPRRSGIDSPPLDAGGRPPPICCGTGYPDLFLANDYGVSELYRQSRRQAVRRGRPRRPASAARRRAA